jgi:hypothetical protein
MSDMRVDAESEDVLRSVLRLVAEDMRVPGHAAVAARVDQGRLLLRPEQRIAAAPPAAPATAPALPATVDEAALRELIRTILREELQGQLGERITRSVRKLAKAEVNHSLASRNIP